MVFCLKKFWLILLKVWPQVLSDFEYGFSCFISCYMYPFSAALFACPCSFFFSHSFYPSFSKLMAYAWQIPEENFAKINIHYLDAVEPLPNGNLNGLGIIVRNDSGVKLWGAVGLVRGMDNVPALIWGTHAGILAALSLGFHKTHIETENREVYDTIRFRSSSYCLQTWRKLSVNSIPYLQINSGKEKRSKRYQSSPKS